MFTWCVNVYHFGSAAVLLIWRNDRTIGVYVGYMTVQSIMHYILAIVHNEF